MNFLSFLLIPLLAPFTIAAFGNCYWPNGDKAPDNWIQCPGQTNCCASGEACLTNDICYQAHLNIAYRGACADKDWPPSTCPHYCYEEVQDTFANIYGCPDNANQQFTCGRPGGWVTQLCDDDMETFIWETSQNFKVAYAELPEPGANASSSSASATPTPSRTNSLGSHSAGACTSTADGSSSHRRVALAAGLGTGLGVPLLLVSIGFLLFWMRTRKQLQEVRAQSQAYANTLYPSQNGMVSVPHGVSTYHGNTTELSAKEAPARELDGSGMRARELEG